MNLQTYLYFNGDCSDAIELYRQAFGASVEFLTTYGEGLPEHVPVGWGEKIFHATIKFGVTSINISDVLRDTPTQFCGFAMLAHVDSAAEAERIFFSLQDGGVVVLPMHPTGWASHYGIVTDRFGVTWKVQT